MNVVLQTQKAIYDLLKGDADLSAMIDDVYDFVPVAAAYPYVTIGDASVKNNPALGVSRYELSLMVNVYSQGKGRRQALLIMEEIFSTLAEQNLTVAGYDFICISFVEMDTDRLNNGDVEGQIHFKILLKDVV